MRARVEEDYCTRSHRLRPKGTFMPSPVHSTSSWTSVAPRLRGIHKRSGGRTEGSQEATESERIFMSVLIFPFAHLPSRSEIREAPRRKMGTRRRKKCTKNSSASSPKPEQRSTLQSNRANNRTRRQPVETCCPIPVLYCKLLFITMWVYMYHLNVVTAL